jgi:glycosyltransferase involved in cell wall biosynthesis
MNEIFSTADELTRRGISVKLLVAGPTSTTSDRELLTKLCKEAQFEVEYLGAIHDAEREAFYKQVDVFLFPSRYRHESFGLVVGEALRRGAPIVAFSNIGLTPTLVGEAGCVLDPSADFPTKAAIWISDVVSSPELWAKAIEGIRAFAQECTVASEEARMMAREMLGD